MSHLIFIRSFNAATIVTSYLPTIRFCRFAEDLLITAWFHNPKSLYNAEAGKDSC